MATTSTGTLYAVATALAAAKAITNISNATEAVVTAPGHGRANGDVVEVTSGWGGLNKRAFEIKGVTTDTFVLVKADTTDTNRYPAGAGAGSVRAVATWVALSKYFNPSTSGGDPKNVEYKFDDSDVAYSLNDGFSATVFSLDFDDDDTTAGYAALRSLTDVQTDTILRMVPKNGSRVYLPCKVALNDVPKMQSGQINRISCQFNGNNRHTRYSA